MSDKRILTKVSLRCGSSLMRKVLEDSSPFLFPCTIEFSLIAAAILFIMWKNVGIEHRHYKQAGNVSLVLFSI